MTTDAHGERAEKADARDKICSSMNRGTAEAVSPECARRFFLSSCTSQYEYCKNLTLSSLRSRNHLHSCFSHLLELLEKEPLYKPAAHSLQALSYFRHALLNVSRSSTSHFRSLFICFSEVTAKNTSSHELPFSGGVYLTFCYFNVTRSCRYATP